MIHIALANGNFAANVRGIFVVIMVLVAMTMWTLFVRAMAVIGNAVMNAKSSMAGLLVADVIGDIVTIATRSKALMQYECAKAVRSTIVVDVAFP